MNWASCGFLFGYIIRAYSKCNIDNIENVLELMNEKGVTPDQTFMTNLLGAYCRQGDIVKAKLAHFKDSLSSSIIKKTAPVMSKKARAGRRKFDPCRKICSTGRI